MEVVEADAEEDVVVEGTSRSCTKPILFNHLQINSINRPSTKLRRGGGMKGGSKVVIEPHRHEGVFIARGKEDALVTLNSTPGVAVYGEKRISVETPPGPDGNTTKVEYRVWNPFRSKSENRY